MEGSTRREVAERERKTEGERQFGRQSEETNEQRRHFKHWCEFSPTRLFLSLHLFFFVCLFVLAASTQFIPHEFHPSFISLSFAHSLPPSDHYHTPPPIMRGWVQAICFHSSRAAPLVTSGGNCCSLHAAGHRCADALPVTLCVSVCVCACCQHQFQSSHTHTNTHSCSCWLC